MSSGLTTAPTGVVSALGNRFWSYLAALAALAAAIRLYVVLYLDRTSPFALAGDGFYYFAAAESVAERGEFGAGAHDVLHPPLWAGFLGLVYKVGFESLLALGLAGGLLGVATVVLVALAGRQILSPRAGLMAGTVVALSPAFWTYERNLNAEAITYPLIAATILLAYRYRPGFRASMMLAGVIGLLALARSEQAILAAVLLLPLVATAQGPTRRQKLGYLAASAGVMLMVIAPWTLYNLGKFENPVILSAGAGNAMLAGACDSTFDGELLGAYDSDCNIENPTFWANTDRTVQDRALRSEAISYTVEHLDRLPVVLFAREGRSWGYFRVAQQVGIQADAVGVAPSFVWIQMVMYWAMVPLSVVGAILLRRRQIMVFPLLVFLAVVAVSTALTFGDIRYRAPAEIPLILLAACAVDVLWDRWTKARRGTSARDADLKATPPGKPVVRDTESAVLAHPGGSAGTGPGGDPPHGDELDSPS